jgi:hypothetical protein
LFGGGHTACATSQGALVGEACTWDGDCGHTLACAQGDMDPVCIQRCLISSPSCLQGQTCYSSSTPQFWMGEEYGFCY